MRKSFASMAVGFLVLSTAGIANAAVLNWVGTSTTLLAASAGI